MRPDVYAIIQYDVYNCISTYFPVPIEYNIIFYPACCNTSLSPIFPHSPASSSSHRIPRNDLRNKKRAQQFTIKIFILL